MNICTGGNTHVGETGRDHMGEVSVTKRGQERGRKGQDMGRGLGE